MPVIILHYSFINFYHHNDRINNDDFLTLINFDELLVNRKYVKQINLL